MIHGRPIVLRRIKPGPELRSCHALFVSHSMRPRVHEILSLLEGTEILTVSDLEGFVDQGGMIGFTAVGEQIRFEVHATRMSKVGLCPGRAMLMLASKVIQQRSDRIPGTKPTKTGCRQSSMLVSHDFSENWTWIRKC